MSVITTSQYTDYYDKTRFQITLRLSLLTCIILALQGILFYFLSQPVVFLCFLGAGICGFIFLILTLTKKYKFGAGMFVLLGGTLCILSLLLLKDAYHFVDPLWMIVLALFAYFTLGKTIGNITVFTLVGSIIYYILFFLNENLTHMRQMGDGELYTLSLNAFSCSVVIAYLISQFIKRNNHAAQQYRVLTSELQLKNELVEQQNTEKTAMLMEIHHRVKNNLQVITSLLRLQSRDLKNDDSISHFTEAIDRIGAMALIHNQMYQSKNLNRVELEPYLNSLSSNILNSYILEIPVHLSFGINVSHIPSKAIVPIALIFNELVSNSLKHAFNDKLEGEISVKIDRFDTHKIILIYTDNGVWKNPERTDSFGLELIETLTEQLNGSLKLNTENGTTYELICEIE